MKKALLVLLFLLAFAGTAAAQAGNTTTIRFAGAPTGGCAPLTFGINSATGDLYDCVSGAWVKVGSAGGGAAPGGASGTLQYNNSGSFGGVTNTTANKADCDGFGDGCQIYYTNPTSVFQYFAAGTNADAPMGNYFACANESDGGVYCNATDGTDTGNMSFAPGSANSGMSVVHSAKATGFNINSVDRVIQSGRIAMSATYTTALTSMLFALGSGWGNTASVTAQGGSDNAFVFQVTTGGTGIAANPTVTYTYADGDFSTSGSAVPVYVCHQTDGNDIISDVTDVPAQTSVALTWHGTPTTAKTYTISCIGFQRS